MTWREEAKELGVPLYDHELKKVRKKVDVLVDIDFHNKRDSIFIDAMKDKTEPVSIIVDLVEVNAIFRQALLDHGAKVGLTNVSIEGCIESLIRKRKLVSCKKRGIVLEGMKDVENTNDTEAEGTDSTETSGSEGTGTDVSGSISESEREDSIEGAEQDV